MEATIQVVGYHLLNFGLCILLMGRINAAKIIECNVRNISIATKIILADSGFSFSGQV